MARASSSAESASWPRPRSLSFKRAMEQGDQLLFAERAQGEDAAAGEQRGDDFEGRVLGGRADEADRAALDVGQKGVLLGLVEAMDFVDEERGARAEGRGFFGVDHDLLDFLDAGEHGGELDEGGAGLLGDDFGERGFADSRRAPEDDRGRVVGLDQACAAVCRGRRDAPARRSHRGCAGACARRAERWLRAARA
jgi:hypothetical protein